MTDGADIAAPPAERTARDDRVVHRPRGWPRHLTALMEPRIVAALARVALERDAALRFRRLRAAAGDALRERAHPTRRRMRALIASPGGRLRWRDVPVPPPPAPDGAIVRPLAVATCDLDRALALGATPFALPLHFGHECVAEVLEVGDAVTTVRPGQRVVVPFQISCGACAPCRAGWTGNCLSVPPVSMYGFGVGGGHWGGAMCDELAVPFADAMLVALPDGIEPVAAASVADNVVDAYRHIGPHLPDILAHDPDAEVLLVGALSRRPIFTASVALYAGLIARALGARHVTLVDSRESVRDHAQRLGLDPIQPRDLRRRRRGAPLVVDLTAHPQGLRLALARTAPDGVCSSVGMLHANARIPVGLMYGRNATLRVSRSHARALIPQVLELMTSGRLHPELVTTAVATMDEAPRALHDHITGGDSTKTIIVA